MSQTVVFLAFDFFFWKNKNKNKNNKKLGASLTRKDLLSNLSVNSYLKEYPQKRIAATVFSGQSVRMYKINTVKFILTMCHFEG